MITDINSEDRLVQKTFADHLENELGWDSVYAWNQETFGPEGTLGRSSERDVALVHDLESALCELNPDLPDAAIAEALEKLTRTDFSRSILQHNEDFYNWCRDGVPVKYRNAAGNRIHGHARVFDFDRPENNRFVAVRELKIQGLRSPHYNRRADLVCFVNGLPLVFIELKAVYRNIRQGFDGNLADYRDTIPHAFHHNAFLVVSNGDRAKYGTLTSEWEHFYDWKRLAEDESGDLDARVLLNGMLAKDRLLDLFENFTLFDHSRSGGVRKVVARNHQFMGVNRAVASVEKQRELQKEFPPEERIVWKEHRSETGETMRLPERAHPDLGRLGVFWHTQGSGKSYSMLFFTEKVRRKVEGDFSFVLMTDRTDLDDQIYKTFAGCGAAKENAPRVSSGKAMREVLAGNHRYVFSLIHKFNQPVDPEQPYSTRDDIIVISDEAHRTQSGKLARNMRLALPNAGFLGFTGTPLFKRDEETRRIFGSYVSRYDFQRSVDDGATVKLMYENRGDKLGLARADLNDRMAQKIETADLTPEEEMRLEQLLGQDYEVITADRRLEQIADDFVEHAATRWEAGKAIFVCIDKVTCGRMYELIRPRWKAKTEELEDALANLEAGVYTGDEFTDAKKLEIVRQRKRQIEWMQTTLIAPVFSEAQGEVAEFRKWKMDVRPHRALMKKGFELPGGETVAMDDAFKDAEHPFRIAIVCAMWLTGFDVECLSTLYLDKPLKAHTLMQAIARANRVYPGKACGVIVDYNGMLKSLREAMALYALGDDTEENGGSGEETEEGEDELVRPLIELVEELREAIEAAETHLGGLGFDMARLDGATGFDRIEAIRDAKDALLTRDEDRRRFQIMAREVFSRYNALLTEPAARPYTGRRDDIETIYKKLDEASDLADVHATLRELHRVVNRAIDLAQSVQGVREHPDSKIYDLSRLNLEALREEFKKATRKKTAVRELRDVIEARLEKMLEQNPLRMDFNRRYQEIIADYNREKDRVTIEQTFERLVNLMDEMTDEDQRSAREGLTEPELAIFDLLCQEKMTKVDRERIKQASRDLLAKLRSILSGMMGWTRKQQTQAEVETEILDFVFQEMPEEIDSADKAAIADRVFRHVWAQTEAGRFPPNEAA